MTTTVRTFSTFHQRFVIRFRRYCRPSNAQIATVGSLKSVIIDIIKVHEIVRLKRFLPFDHLLPYTPTMLLISVGCWWQLCTDASCLILLMFDSHILPQPIQRFARRLSCCCRLRRKWFFLRMILIVSSSHSIRLTSVSQPWSVQWKSLHDHRT